MNKQGLRALKKETTAYTLAQTAFQLTLERGLNGFTVEDVTSIAGYSRRTFANHYACKEEAVAMAVVPHHGIDEIIELIEKMPENTSPLDVMYQFTKLQLTKEVLQKLQQLIKLSRTYGTLQPYTLAVVYQLQSSAQKLLNDLFQGHYPIGYTHFLAGSVCSIILSLIDDEPHVLFPGESPEKHPDSIAFQQYLDTAFDYLRNGF